MENLGKGATFCRPKRPNRIIFHPKNALHFWEKGQGPKRSELSADPEANEVRAIDPWWPRRESNPHAVKRALLRRVCLPVPPLGLKNTNTF